MKNTQIYVSNGHNLSLSSGEGVAVYPIQKGGTHSFILLADGRMVSMKGSRIGGLGVPRFLMEKGFTLAEPGNPFAEKLADLLDVRDGTKLVEDASQKHARQLQQELGGKSAQFVPFAEGESTKTIHVEVPGHFTHTIFDLSSGFSSGSVGIEFNIENNLCSSLALNTGWIVPPEVDASTMPRNTEYGGTVELAVLTICNCGLGTLVGTPNLVMDNSDSVTEPFPRGKMTVELTSGDTLIVGIDALDEMIAQYVRNGQVIYSRTGLNALSLGRVIGSIAAVLVRVQEQDADLMNRFRKKAA